MAAGARGSVSWVDIFRVKKSLILLELVRLTDRRGILKLLTMSCQRDAALKLFGFYSCLSSVAQLGTFFAIYTECFSDATLNHLTLLLTPRKYSPLQLRCQISPRSSLLSHSGRLIQKMAGFG